jgi:hypothetical protein
MDEEKELIEARAAATAKYRKKDKPATETIKNFDAYEAVGKDISKIAAGDLDWTVGDDGGVSSDFWKGKYYGSRSEAGKIQRFSVGDDGQVYMEFGKGTDAWDENQKYIGKEFDKIAVNEENARNILVGYVQAQGKLSQVDAEKYVDALEEEGGSLIGLLPDVDKTKIEKVKAEAENKKKAKVKAELVSRVLEAVENRSGENTKVLKEALEGKTINGKKVVDVTQNAWKKGNYDIEFDDDSVVAIGDGHGEETLKALLEAGDDPLGLFQ